MPLQNRVTPLGEIVVSAARGTMMGNRGGCFHRQDQTLRARPWASRQWICCELAFKGRRRALMQPGLYTELFFLDEATALAAGHRPCFECRRAEALEFARAWTLALGGKERARARAPEMDCVLHRERIDEACAKRTYAAELGRLPRGSMILRRGKPYLVAYGRLLRWREHGYLSVKVPPAAERVEVLTPPSVVAVLGAGYRPRFHETAFELL